MDGYATILSLTVGHPQSVGSAPVKLSHAVGSGADARDEFRRRDDRNVCTPAQHPALHRVEVVYPQGQFETAVPALLLDLRPMPDPLPHTVGHLRREPYHHAVVALAHKSAKRLGKMCLGVEVGWSLKLSLHHLDISHPGHRKVPQVVPPDV